MVYRFERVYPVPDWAIPPKEPERKRRRRDSDSGSESSGSEMDLDEENVSAPPLSELLQSNQGWVKTNDRKSGTKLRPEVLNIARLIDANNTGGSLVSFLMVFGSKWSSLTEPRIVRYQRSIFSPLTPPPPLIWSRQHHSPSPYRWQS